MNFNIQEASVCFFLGSMATNYLWNKRFSILHHVSQFACEKSKSLWTKSIGFFKKQKEQIVKRKRKNMDEQNNEGSDNQLVQKEQQKIQEIQARKEKKIKKQIRKKPQNLSRSIKRYQDWFLTQRSQQNGQQNISHSKIKMLQKFDLDILKERILDFETKLQDEEEIGVNKLQVLLQTEQVQHYGSVLGYNPFADEQQSLNKQKIFQMRRISSIQ